MSSTKKSVLESGVNSTKDSSVGREKGRVCERTTRMTVKASKHIGCVLSLCSSIYNSNEKY